MGLVQGAQPARESGRNADGTKRYDNVNELWQKEVGTEEEGRQGWYSKAIEYWTKQDASVNGVLGGFEETSAPDLRASTKFLKQILALSDTKLPNKPTYGRALDCGAGMGRVTKGLLLKQFKEVDLVEPVGSLLEKAKTYVESKRAINFFEKPLQAFEPEPFRYDVIWNQWVLLYLPDDDLIAYLKKCAEALRENGLICVKENVVMEGQFIVDDEDNSITRTHAQYRKIFEMADLELVLEQRQTDWPQDLFPVMQYALKPKVYMKPKAAESIAEKKGEANEEQAEGKE